MFPRSSIVRLHPGREPSEVEDTDGAPVTPRVPVREVVRRFWPYARRLRLHLALSALLVVLVPAIQAAEIWMFKLAIDDVLVPRDLGPLAGIACAYLALAVLEGAVSFAGDYLTTLIGETFLLDLRTSVFEHLQRLSLEFFDRRSVGDLVSRLTGDVATIEAFVLSGVTRVLAYIVQVGIFAGLLFYLRWELALVALVVAPLAWAAMRYFSRRIKDASRAKRRRLGSLSSAIEESLGGIQVVQAYNRQEHEVARFRRESLGSASAELASTRLKALFSPLVDLLKVSGLLAVIAIGTLELERGRLTLGGLMVFLTYLTRLYSPIHGLSRFGNSIFAASAGAERIVELLDERPTVTERPHARPISAKGVVEFDGVSFRYPGRPDDTLVDVSFRLEPGETLAVVGPSGAGKSTIAKLMLRFYDPSRGTVRLDGVDLRELQLDSLRDNVALLLQDAPVFDGSIRENIVYGRPDADQDAVVRAAVQADAHDFVTALPDGYDTWIGQRGRRLSGGERQRIAIARAMIRDAAVLLLDEPTTGLDARSARRVVDPLRRLMSGRTTIVITHNLALVKGATSILVLDHGQVVEAGEHLELFARGGLYSELADLSQNGPEPVPGLVSAQ
jgi:ATP-binding cassette, subfamily B, bacterial